MTSRFRLWLVCAGGAGLAALLVAACLDLPRFGGDRHPYGDRAVRASLARHTANTIASVNFDQRAYDTLGEMTILFAAVLGCVVLLRQTRDEHRARPEPTARVTRKRAVSHLTALGDNPTSATDSEGRRAGPPPDDPCGFAQFRSH